ncbi:MAG: hypothetical protein Q9217_000317 [Psora testacea]
MGTDDTLERLSYLIDPEWFEKSLYDLIRGLRNHKGNEREYIRHSLQECRSEIKGADMDLKATALLKLIYLEMFGHDMSWASFHVLEVMSSQKYLQKRVGYLAAVQSFRPDTEVLMLATNLLKKDVSSSLPPTVSLPLVTLPHIITSSLALSLLSDLQPRLSHSNPNIRKKTVATLYRLALVYPDSLKSAWPRIKDLLMDEDQDPSVTAAVVNVVCELGWRRPKDFLSLAPRLFELLVDGGNNWMAIKIIKLPRLIKKLLPPLTNLIRTTPAMSLLYECINGVIQGGILEGTEGAREGEEIASLCVNKLRGMILVEGDPNLRYVALLAFNKIATSHPHLVSMQEDAIMNCIDDPDITIRLKALDLSVGMVHSENLIGMVERLVHQLRSTPVNSGTADDGRCHANGVEPAADSDGENPEEVLRQSHELREGQQTLPAEYRVTIICRILGMCSKNNYANLSDFEWYIEILLQLVEVAPIHNIPLTSVTTDQDSTGQGGQCQDILSAIGWELRNVAVRVTTVREEALKAAYSLIAASRNKKLPNSGPIGSESVLSFAAWVSGEYVRDSTDAYDTLDALLRPGIESLPPHVICAYVQAIPKVLAHIVSEASLTWDAERRSVTSLLVARIVRFLEPLTNHPDLEVQERAVEFLELMRVGSQAIENQESESGYEPLLLTKALPGLFSYFDLNPVAPTAQRKVPIPPGLDLDTPINDDLTALLQHADNNSYVSPDTTDFEFFYRHRPIEKAVVGHGVDALSSYDDTSSSYQQTEDSAIDAETIMRKRVERRERNKDDPFYIAGGEPSSGISTPFHDILRRSNGDDVDIDSIPIMDLELGDQRPLTERSEATGRNHKRRRSKKVRVVLDETIDHEGPDHQPGRARDAALTTTYGKKKSLLEVDTSGLGSLSLEAAGDPFEQPISLPEEAEDLEMARALDEVEKLRLEMQRASERVQATDGVPAEGTLVKKKKQKRKEKQKPTFEQQGSNESAGEPGRGFRHDTRGAKGDAMLEKKKKKYKKQKPLGMTDNDAPITGI